MSEELESSAFIVHYLGAFDLFSTCFSVWACSLSYFHITTGFHPGHDRINDHDHERRRTEIQQ